jgi:Flp pilus assembly CpaE family ATPase
MNVIVDLAFGESSATEPATDARASDVDALQTHLHRAVRSEQVRDVIPHLAIDVVAVGMLEIRDVDLVAETLGARGESRHARRQSRECGVVVARGGSGTSRIGLPTRAASK